MTITFRVLDKVQGRGDRVPQASKDSVQLVPDDWDDYSFKTSFQVVLYDSQGQPLNLGTVKIGHHGQSHGWTLNEIPKKFENLPTGWFSLGQDVDYYDKVFKQLTPELRAQLLRALGDVVSDDLLFRAAQDEGVFRDSLMRGVSLSVIHGQFRRVLAGQVMSPCVSLVVASVNQSEVDEDGEAFGIV